MSHLENKAIQLTKSSHLLKVFSLILALTLTSCFEIREVISIDKQGNGNYKMVMDFSESKQMFKMMLEMAESEEGKMAGIDANPLGGLDSAFNELAIDLNYLTGISNAQSIQNKEDFIFGIQLEFENVDALNMALARMDAGGQAIKPKAYYQYSKGKLEKANIFNLQNLTSEIIPDGNSNTENQELNDQLNALYESVTYRMVIQTSGRIRKYSNEEAVLSQDKQELYFVKPLKEINSNNINLSNIVRFK